MTDQYLTRPDSRKLGLAAQNEANDLLNHHPEQAAAIYLEMARDTRSTPAEIARMIADPDNDWTTAPAGVERMADFMHKTGRLRHELASWKQVYMPEVQGLTGS